MSSFVMPEVKLGQAVLWYSDGMRDTAPAAAIVTQVGSGHITVSTFQPDMQMASHSGVQHLDDPRLRNHNNGEGAWEHTEWNKRLMSTLESAPTNGATKSRTTSKKVA